MNAIFLCELYGKRHGSIRESDCCGLESTFRTPLFGSLFMQPPLLWWLLSDLRLS